ncbi:aromatic ring-hydroxylating dioxygenase subunit alpha [Alterisphingorhabdus coralli]|uniref:Aromatic ring-hydroxylating dioxygenase subunit alpha n=1 Tax=Alterisphingorhabdus coralli TaxID=3071408 RepID=A0AA97I0X7_9SPHN|nr:aromatic ring-hydroxylating dioxygenase subunit alpha [Parasphingorhabdus sp. SCSIO 66989]WOE74670.1 aromatic ring-hydroxylating dioxygenase subunit alpha [Parasphingorhabdus sp. SCSIO 66989]
MATMPSDAGLTPEQFDRVAPTNSYWDRFRQGASAVRKRTMKRMAERLGLSDKDDIGQAELQLFTSEAAQMAEFYFKEYGSAEKPQSLGEVPWDYVEEYQEEIPFFGLREYWYPAAFSHELKHNEHKAVELLGDNIVLFRDKDGSPCALENRCPHRGPLLSLGQTNAVEIGTITCRYHGMTFNKHGECVAFLADGPNSPACGKVKAKSYPAEEVNGVIFVYMGIKEPEPFLDSMPHAREVMKDGRLIRSMMNVPYSYLNQLDNTVDMTHVGCLHRTCYLFGDQKMGGGVAFEELPGNGVYARLRDMGGHGGSKAIDDIRWFMPNLVHHGEEFMDGGVHGIFFWFVPQNAGSFNAWLIGSINEEKVGKAKAKFMATTLKRALQSDALPGMACFIGGDAPMQMAQGRIARWDKDYLARTDRAVIKVRQMMKDAHKAEQELRKQAGLDPLAHRVSKNTEVKAATG